MLEVLAEHGIEVPVLTLGIPDEFVEHGPTELLYQSLGLDAVGLARRVAQFAAIEARV